MELDGAYVCTHMYRYHVPDYRYVQSVGTRIVVCVTDIGIQYERFIPALNMYDDMRYHV